MPWRRTMGWSWCRGGDIGFGWDHQEIGYYMGMAKIQYILTWTKLDNLATQQPTGGPIEDRTENSQPLLCATLFNDFSLWSYIVRYQWRQGLCIKLYHHTQVSIPNNRYYFWRQFAVRISALNYVRVGLN